VIDSADMMLLHLLFTANALNLRPIASWWRRPIQCITWNSKTQYQLTTTMYLMKQKTHTHIGYTCRRAANLKSRHGLKTMPYAAAATRRNS